MEIPFRDTCPADLKVIETLRYDPAEGIRRRDRHLDRMATTCARLSIGFDRRVALGNLAAATGPDRLRLRLTIDLKGAIEVTGTPLAATPEFWRIAIAPERLRSDDPWLSVKTTRRALYDRARAALRDGIDEVIFLNERGEVCEGTITNIFAETSDSLLTPPASSGLLPGILRGELITAGRARPAILTADDLAGSKAVFVGNSLRGLIRARFV